MSEKKTIKIKRNKILCMFSGGLDSLGALYLLLKDPAYQDKQIHVHHLVLKNLENRYIAEKASCEKIVNYFKSNSYRSFTMTESQHDMSFLKKYFVYDSVMYGFMAANMVLNDLSISQIAIGSNFDDKNNRGSIERANKGRSLFQTMLPEKVRYITNYLYPVAHLSKYQIWQMLPEELRKMAWSCRQPVYLENKISPCKKCRTCLEMKQIIKADSQSAWAHPLGLG